MFYIIASRLPMISTDHTSKKYLKLFILGSILYLVISYYLFMNQRSGIIERIKKYFYYVMGIDLSIALTLAKFLAPKVKIETEEPEYSDKDKTKLMNDLAQRREQQLLAQKTQQLQQLQQLHQMQTMKNNQEMVAHPEAKMETKMEAKSEPKPETKFEAKSELKSKSKSTTKSKSKSKSKSDSDDESSDDDSSTSASESSSSDESSEKDKKKNKKKNKSNKNKEINQIIEVASKSKSKKNDSKDDGTELPIYE